MRRLTPQELVDRYADMGSLGSEVEHLPWANLRVVHEHRYPALKVWPKLRNFHAGMPDAWSKIAWRPLGDYSKHHWRKPLSMVGKWATHTVRTLGWGWGKEDPRAVVERIHDYNGVRRARMLGGPTQRRRTPAELLFQPRARNGRARWIAGPGVAAVKPNRKTSRIRTFDVKNFFPSLCRIKLGLAVVSALEETWRRFPDMRYF